MKRRLLSRAVLIVALAVVVESASIEQILRYRTLGEVQVSPDGNTVVVVATHPNFETNVLDSNLWLVDANSRLSSQLTVSGHRDWHPRFSPNGGELLFLSDRGGAAEIWRLNLRGGEAHRLFNSISDVTNFQWLPDGQGVIFTMLDELKDRDVLEVDAEHAFARLYRFDWSSVSPELLTEKDFHINSFDLSPDATWAALSIQPTPSVPDARLHSDLKVLDLESRLVRDLVTRPGMDRDPKISPDGTKIAFVTMKGNADWIGNYGVSVVKREGTELSDVSAAIDERVTAPLRWSSDGETIYVIAPNRTSRRIYAVDVKHGTSEVVTSFDESKVVNSFDLFSKGRLVVTASDAHTPAEVYEVGGDEEPKQLTMLNVSYNDNAVGRTEILTYERDGLTLEGLLVKPVGFKEGTKYPLLLVIHGGPAGVFEYAFRPRRGVYPIHAFSEVGYLVFMPNPRGSGGYGESFRKSNFQDWGFGDFEDILAGVDLLIDRGLADDERMGVMGWSYGGYMTSWMVTHTNRFKAASIGAPVTNPYSFYGVTDIPDFAEAYFGGRPGDDVNYLRHAPENFVRNATTPSLIQHGAEDVRVPLSQGTTFYRALKRNGVDTEMVIYPREPHGLREPNHIRDAMNRNLEWFSQWLGKDSASN